MVLDALVRILEIKAVETIPELHQNTNILWRFLGHYLRKGSYLAIHWRWEEEHKTKNSADVGVCLGPRDWERH